MELSQPRGMRDYNIYEAETRRNIVVKIEDIFKLFGFNPLETPALESIDILNAKAYGEESSKELYVLEGEKTGLRYDLTVPLARYVSMNKDIPLPFKRYQIGYVWRKEEPQKMRYREFLQADIDIVGSSSIASDAEVIAAAAYALEELGIQGYTIFLNSRMLLNKILSFFGIKNDRLNDAIRIIDKLYKIGMEEAEAQLMPMCERSRELVEFMAKEEEDSEKFLRLASNMPEAAAEIDEIKNLIALLKEYNLNNNIKLDISIARGLDYYTGLIWEFVVFDDGGKRLPTIVSGGRYDKLIGIYSDKDMPATGISIGIDRIIDVMMHKGIGASGRRKVFIVVIGRDNLPYSINAANALRSAGICADLDVTTRNISKQLEYANSMKFEYALIIGNSERNANKVRIRNLVAGEEQDLSIEEAVNILKS